MATCLFVLGVKNHLYHLVRLMSDFVSQRGHRQEHFVLLDQFAPLLKMTLFRPLQHIPDSSGASSFNIDSIVKSSIKHENNQRLCESARCLLLVRPASGPSANGVSLLLILRQGSCRIVALRYPISCGLENAQQVTLAVCHSFF